MFAVLITGIFSGITYFTFNLQAALITVLFVLCMIPAIVSLNRQTFDIFEPIVFYSVFMFMTTIAIFDRVYVKDPHFIYPEWVSWEFSTAFLIVSALYVLFFGTVLIGYYLNLEQWFTIPTFTIGHATNDGKILRRIGLLYVAIGTVCYALLVRTSLNWDLLYLYTTSEPRSQIFDGAYHFRLGARAMYVGYLLWITGILASGRRTGLHHLFPLIPISALFLMLGGRGQVILINLVAALMLYYVHIFPLFETVPRHIKLASDCLHRRFKLLILPMAGLIIGFGTIIAGIIRKDQSVTKGLNTANLIEIATFGIHNSHLDHLLVALTLVPDQIGYYWGAFGVRVLLNYIPRSLWPGKPALSAGSELRRVFLPDGTGGRPPGMIGQFYMDGDIFGVIIGALVFGVVLRILYISLRKNGTSPLFLLVYSLCFASVATQGGISNNSLWYVSNHLLLLSPALLFLKYINIDN